MRKKLFAILMSAMMMVTFMPAMAFAAYNPTADKNAELAKRANQVVLTAVDYETVTAKYDNTTITAKTAKTFNTTSGKVEVTADATDVAAQVSDSSTFDKVMWRNNKAGRDYREITKAEVFVAAAKKVVARYYDLTGSTLAYSAKKAIPTNLNRFEFDGILNASAGNKTYAWTGIMIYEPAALVKAGATAKSAYVDFSHFDYALTATQGTFDVNTKDAQTVKITVATTDHDGASPIEAGVIEHTYQIAAGTYTAYDAKFYVDTVKAGNEWDTLKNDLTYDAAEHKIVMKDMAGFSVAYEKYNATNGKWEAVDAITFKDAVTGAHFRATVKNTDATKTWDKNVYYFTVTVAPATLTATMGANTVFEGASVDPWDYVVLTSVPAAAAKADKDAIIAALKTVANATATKKSVAGSALDSGYAVVEEYDIQLVKKTTVPTADETAFKKALANYDANTLFAALATADNGNIKVVEGRANEVEFLGNATATKTVHVKSAKAVKKATTRTIKAEAKSGTAITFKKMSGSKYITVAADGTMTIKKGLKKGTYKVVVKATAAAGNGYKAASAKETYTVKVVK